jgi:hypothetical protein
MRVRVANENVAFVAANCAEQVLLLTSRSFYTRVAELPEARREHRHVVVVDEARFVPAKRGRRGATPVGLRFENGRGARDERHGLAYFVWKASALRQEHGGAATSVAR